MDVVISKKRDRSSKGGWEVKVLSAARPFVTTVLSLSAAIIVWHVLSSTVLNPRLVPPPLIVLRTALPMIQTGEIFNNIGISLWRIAVGFTTGTLLAVVIGVPMGRLRIVNEAVEPVIEVLRYLSPTAMIPIAIIWFGIGEMSKYFLIFWATFFFVLLNTVAGVVRTPLARQRAAQCLGAGRMQIFLLIVIPSAIPYIVTGMRVAMASAFMAIIPAEMLAADSGLGYLLQQSGVLMQTNRIFVALAAICLLGFVTDRIFQWLVNITMSRYLMKPALA
jgi:NitT/TauT family transport system permease protein/taurine transport system permease protein